MGKTFLELLKAKRRIKELEAELEPIAPPEIVGQITYRQLRTLIEETFPQLEYQWQWDDIRLADRMWDLTTVAEMERFLAKDDTNEMVWKKHAPDCDDFTRRLLGNLTTKGWWSIVKGDLWIGGDNWGHSIMITVLCLSVEDVKPVLRVVEPQTDAMETAQEMFEDFKVRLIKI